MTTMNASDLVEPSGRRRRSMVRATEQFLAVLLLILIAVIMLTPLAWLVSTALKEQKQIFTYPPEWIPNPAVWSNFPDSTTV